MTEHHLKIEEQYLDKLHDGVKTAEVRLNDRDYQVGDLLVFYNSHQDQDEKFEITHVHSGLGMKENYVVLSIKWHSWG